MVDEFVDLVLRQRERISLYGLFSHGAIDQMPVRLLREVEHDRSCAKVNALVADRRRSITPALPASIWSAYQAGIVRSGIHGLHCFSAAVRCIVIVDEEFCICGITDLNESLAHQRL